MSVKDTLKERFGAHVRESMGAGRGPGDGLAAPASGPAFHGETAKYQGAARIKDALSIEVDRLAPDPGQPRKEFAPEALAELAASLKARGQLQPIRVRWEGSVSRWIIIAGERRWRAAQLAGLTALQCVEAKGTPTPDDVLEDQLVENCLREDLKPIEQAHAFKTLIDRRGFSYRQLAETLHIAPASVARALALLELPRDLQARVTAGELAPSVAYEVSRLDDHDQQREVAAKVVNEGLNRAETVKTVEAVKAAARGRGPKAKNRKATSCTFKAAGCKVTVENSRGVDNELIRMALTEALGQVESRLTGGEQSAA